MNYPRKILRVVSIYRCSRLMAGSVADKEFSRKLLHWITLLEQLHVRASWLLQVLEDDEQSDKYFLVKRKPKLIFEWDLQKVCWEQSFLYSSRHRSYRTLQQTSYSWPRTWTFYNFLKFTDLMISDLGGFSARSKHDLLSYTTNLNPALRSALAVIASYRENADTINRQMRVTYTVRSAKALAGWCRKTFRWKNWFNGWSSMGSPRKTPFLEMPFCRKSSNSRQMDG